jgi:nucleoside-diphosphate-sugar epimerase/ubiquinone/menaquinone biosynthesis C-methylase UbiE
MIIVTGATGFIGRRVVRLLVAKYKPSSILCLVRDKENVMETEGREILRGLGVKMQKVDLVTGKGLGNITTTPEIVIHLAGITDTDSSDFRCNDIGTKKLLKSLNNKLGPNTKFIHISTTALMAGRKICSSPFDEEAFPTPSNNYGRSKLRAETAVKEICHKKNLKLIILRYPTVYGKEPRSDSFFDYIVKMIKSNSVFVRFSWPGLTSFVHVDDAAKAVLMAVGKTVRSGSWETYNVSSESLTLPVIVKTISRKIGKPYRPIAMPKIFWKLVSYSRPLIYKSEAFLPPAIYNMFWRASLLVDDVILCDASKLEKEFPEWKPDMLTKRIEDVIPANEIRVDQEIKHFSDLRHIWPGQGTPAGQKRYDNKGVLFRKYCGLGKNERMLEIGCGDGEFTKRLRGIGAQIVATDITPAVVERGEKRLSFPGLEYKVDNCENLSFRNGTFSVVCGVSILHHVGMEKTLREAYRVLQKGGRIFFTEPNLINPIIFLATNIKWLREKMELSPGERALLRKDVEAVLKNIGFKKVIVRNYDFLLPWAPEFFIKPLEKFGVILEKTPLIKEISGSLLIYAEK